MTDAEKIALLREFVESYIDFCEDTILQCCLSQDGKGLWYMYLRKAKEVLKKTDAA